MFQTIAIPFDAFANLPTPAHRWLLTCFSRYVDKAGIAFPSLRQLARDARISLASVSRYMASMEELGVFQRERKPGGRYRYILAEAYRPRWPRSSRSAPAREGVSAQQPGVPHAATQEANPAKQIRKTRARDNSKLLSTTPEEWQDRLRFWRRSHGAHWNTIGWGPRPNEPGCLIPPAMLSEPVFQP